MIRKLGQFMEFVYWREEDSPSIRTFLKGAHLDDEERIVGYLKSAPPIVVSPGIVEDVLEPGKVIDGGPYILTDGEWVWVQEITYYVEEYGLELPEMFVEHVRKNEYRPPNDEGLDLDGITEELWNMQGLRAEDEE